MSGIKNDTNKTRYELLSGPALAAMTAVLTDGAREYTDRNWERGLPYSRVLGAALGHLLTFGAGHSRDPSGHSHLAHALCEVMFLLHYELQGGGEDDRPDHRKGMPEDRSAENRKGIAGGEARPGAEGVPAEPGAAPGGQSCSVAIRDEKPQKFMTADEADQVGY